MEAFIPIFIIVAILIIALGVYSHQKEKERRAALEAWAKGKGLYFHPDKVYHFDDEYPSFKFLRQGSNRYASNIITGTMGERRVTVCDYHYETHSTDSKGNRQTHHHHFSCAFVQPEFSLGQMVIRREGVFDWVKSTFGFGDINFESVEFSKKFHVTGADKRWVYDVVNPRMMEFLLGSPMKTTIETDEFFLFVRQNNKLSPLEVEGFMNYTLAFLDHVPDHVKNQSA